MRGVFRALTTGFPGQAAMQTYLLFVAGLFSLPVVLTIIPPRRPSCQPRNWGSRRRTEHWTG